MAVWLDDALLKHAICSQLHRALHPTLCFIQDTLSQFLFILQSLQTLDAPNESSLLRIHNEYKMH